MLIKWNILIGILYILDDLILQLEYSFCPIRKAHGCESFIFLLARKRAFWEDNTSNGSVFLSRELSDEQALPGDYRGDGRSQKKGVDQHVRMGAKHPGAI